MSACLTRVNLVFVPLRMNVYLRFAQPVQQRYFNWRCHSAYFAPGQVLCRIWWEGNEYGTTRLELAILQAKGPRQCLQKLVGITPGAAVLLRVQGGHQVQQVLRLISAIQAQQIDPASVSPCFWRVLQNRLATHGETPVYTPARHAAKVWREAVA
jgi:hypothetical protein